MHSSALADAVTRVEQLAVAALVVLLPLALVVSAVGAQGVVGDAIGGVLVLTGVVVGAETLRARWGGV